MLNRVCPALSTSDALTSGRERPRRSHEAQQTTVARDPSSGADVAIAFRCFEGDAQL